ncbi:Uncharacterised protein [Algoriella xinjiangensis]|uniref:hypothetical protein n=1 Tax=Algoriella xinjiangensis TaxID=684065 RepID=UPI000F63DFB7|nr:hypothetical protein [Algoriella xinjiangensis]VDH16148.1 Uncharacterised protein [Algoriella xinjiangensis]
MGVFDFLKPKKSSIKNEEIIEIKNNLTKPKLTSFLNMSFGSSEEVVHEEMTQKGAKLFGERTESTIAYNNISFGGFDVDFIIFYFFEGKFCKSSVYFNVITSEFQLLDKYFSIKTNIDSKYYLSDKHYETYNYPFYKDDGQLILGLQIKEIDIKTFWNFPNSNSNYDDDYISISLDERLNLILTYENTFLNTQYVDFYTSKRMDDF